MKNSAAKKPDYFAGLSIVARRDIPIVSIASTLPLDKRLNLIIKRVFDVLVSLALLFFLFTWICPFIALLIKMDSTGPVFFLQKRHKKRRGLFTCIKFRTMIENDEADHLAAAPNDTRITRIGRILRRHHLDELPQLLNVLSGDMSMVGPRPYMISDNQKYGELIRDYELRYRVKPGITGLAQVFDLQHFIPGVDHMQERLNRDILYIHHWTPFLDFKIMVKTISKMIR